MSIKEKDNEQLRDETLESVEVSEDTVAEATAPEAKGTAGAKFGQGADFKDDKKQDFASGVSQMEAPKTKAGVIAAAVDKLSKYSKMEDLQHAYARLVNEESKVEVKEEYDVETDLAALIESDSNLSEEFKEKSKVIFEAALNSRVKEEASKLEEQFQNNLTEKVEEIRTDLIEKINGYLDYVVEQWMEENELAVETGIRSEIAESFIASLKQVFVEHYVEVPETKVDLVDQLAKQAEELESQLMASTEQSVKLAEEVENLTREKIVREATEGMVATDAGKLTSLIEGVDYEDAESFAKKVSIIKEAHFKKDVKETTVTEEIEEPTEQTSTSPRMAAYAAAISRTAKK